MTFTLVKREPFPRVPGADVLGVPVWADGRCNAEPLLFIAALDDIERDAGKDARPKTWRGVLDGVGSAENLARVDLADAFAAKGLRYFSSNDDVSVGTWTLHGKEISGSQACRTFWPVFRAAVIAGLNDSQEMAGAARVRISATLEIRRTQDTEAQAEEDLQFLNRRSWEPSVAVFWLAFRDIRIARKMASGHSSYAHLQIAAVTCASVSVELDADGAGRVIASDPLRAFLAACVRRPGMLEGVTPGKPGFNPIDVRFLEQGALKFQDARMERASAFDIEWTGVCVDRAQLLEDFPPPAVIVMRFVRSLWEREDRRRAVAVALMEWVARLFSDVRQPEETPLEADQHIAANDAGETKRRGGRSRKLREIIKATIRDLISEHQVEPSPKKIRARLRATKAYPDGKDPDDDTIAAALAEIHEELAAAAVASAEGNNPVIAS